MLGKWNSAKCTLTKQSAFSLDDIGGQPVDARHNLLYAVVFVLAEFDLAHDADDHVHRLEDRKSWQVVRVASCRHAL